MRSLNAASPQDAQFPVGKVRSGLSLAVAGFFTEEFGEHPIGFHPFADGPGPAPMIRHDHVIVVQGCASGYRGGLLAQSWMMDDRLPPLAQLDKSFIKSAQPDHRAVNVQQALGG